jgi:DNA-directed RNA polymerase specialized sigma54-like protein
MLFHFQERQRTQNFSKFIPKTNRVLKQSLQQRMLQKLSPQQIQLMKMLQLPTLELEQRIKEEMEENPALDEGEDLEELKKIHLGKKQLRMTKEKILISKITSMKILLIIKHRRIITVKTRKKSKRHLP